MTLAKEHSKSTIKLQSQVYAELFEQIKLNPFSTGNLISNLSDASI